MISSIPCRYICSRKYMKRRIVVLIPGFSFTEVIEGFCEVNYNNFALSLINYNIQTNKENNNIKITNICNNYPNIFEKLYKSMFYDKILEYLLTYDVSPDFTDDKDDLVVKYKIKLIKP